MWFNAIVTHPIGLKHFGALFISSSILGEIYVPFMFILLMSNDKLYGKGEYQKQNEKKHSHINIMGVTYTTSVHFTDEARCICVVSLSATIVISSTISVILMLLVSFFLSVHSIVAHSISVEANTHANYKCDIIHVYQLTF